MLRIVLASVVLVGLAPTALGQAADAPCALFDAPQDAGAVLPCFILAPWSPPAEESPDDGARDAASDEHARQEGARPSSPPPAYASSPAPSLVAPIVEKAAPLLDQAAPLVEPVLAGVPADFDLDWLLNPRSVEDAAPAPAPRAEALAPTSIQEAPPETAAVLATAPLALVAAATAAAPALTTTFDRFRRFALALGLYARIAKERLLDHEGRERLLEHVRSTPGATLADLARASGISRNTTVYHLRRLEKEGLVSSLKNGRARLYYAPGSREKREEAGALAALRHPMSRALAQGIGAAPGVDQRGLCERLGIQPSLAHWHAARLVEAGIVTRSREGRHVRYYPGTSFHLVS